MFVTSCYTIPLSGEIFTIDVSLGDQELLPTAHTSFKKLVIPEYTSKEQLNKKFAVALNCCDFGKHANNSLSRFIFHSHENMVGY